MDAKQFTSLVALREQKLFRISRTLLASAADCEDAIQETLLRAWRHAGDVRDGKYFDTWLIRILINECRRVTRKGRRTTAVMPEDPPARNPALQEALRALEEKYRLVIVMHYLEGYSTQELARILRLPAGTVKWRLNRARALLRESLSEEATP